VLIDAIFVNVKLRNFITKTMMLNRVLAADFFWGTLTKKPSYC